MKSKIISFLAMIAILFVFGLLVEGASPQVATGQSRPGAQGTSMERIAVMPFIKAIPGENITETLDSPISRFYFNYENISSDADRILTQHIQEALRERHGAKVVRLREVEEVYERIPKDETKDTPRVLAQKLGAELKATNIMIGMVWRYRERIGGSYGAERPASVAFAVYLIDTVNGRLLWKAQYKETQRSLSENILATPAFIKRRGRWLSATELVEGGIKDIFARYPF